jgi:hypothetical protein
MRASRAAISGTRRVVPSSRIVSEATRHSFQDGLSSAPVRFFEHSAFGTVYSQLQLFRVLDTRPSRPIMQA